ncbi:MAG: glycosyltransferase family 2 protein [Clostridia bacterium]|nr:glycosyltransferase family 2 protein [Clostridia bacterium]
MILVSIIIPAYNTENFIGKCLERLTKQDYKNIEIIVMNDGSTDKTLDIALTYAKLDTRIKVFSQENSGTAIARINGASKATGEYILFLDSDDFYEDKTISKLVEIAQKYNTDLVKFRYQKYPQLTPQPLIIENVNHDLVIYKKDFTKVLYPLFITTYKLNTNYTLMIKKSCFKVKDIDSYRGLRFAEDLKLCLELFDNVTSVTIIPDILYNYYTNPTSCTLSSDINKILYNIDNFVTVYSLIYEYLKKWNMYTEQNLKLLNIKVLQEIAVFYKKIKLCDDKIYLAQNEDKIRKLIYSDIVNNAINSISISDLDKNYKYYDTLIAVYNREI